MKGAFRAIMVMSLVAFSAGSIEAAEPNVPGDGLGHRIVVVNESATPVRVYVEDSQGERYALGRLERGRTQAFDAPAGVMEHGEFRVRVHPDYYAQRFTDPAKITTRPLEIADNETVVLWLDRELSRSTVEVWVG